MSRLSPAQWLNVRATWESSPHSGYTWLTAAGGGPWPVTREAVRQRALREAWTKRPPPPDAAAQATVARAVLAELAGDENPRHEAASAGDGAKSAGGDGATGVEYDEVRERVLDHHRRELRAARRVLWQTLVQAETAQAPLKARLIKIAVEGLVRIQAAEHNLYGLDLAGIDIDKLSDEQVAAFAAGRWPKT